MTYACHATRLLGQQYGIRHIWPRILSGYGKYDNRNSSGNFPYVDNQFMHLEADISKIPEDTGWNLKKESVKQ